LDHQTRLRRKKPYDCRRPQILVRNRSRQSNQLGRLKITIPGAQLRPRQNPLELDHPKPRSRHRLGAIPTRWSAKDQDLAGLAIAAVEFDPHTALEWAQKISESSFRDELTRRTFTTVIPKPPTNGGKENNFKSDD
jgi:hypothetical protein